MSSNLIPARVDASRTAPNRHLCLHSTHLYMNLGEAHALRDRYGSQMLTSGKQYRATADLTRAEQIDEACGALTWMTNRGFTNARGMFAAAYPGGREPLTDEIVTEVVRGTCGYVWARNYGAYTGRYHPIRADGTLSAPAPRKPAPRRVLPGRQRQRLQLPTHGAVQLGRWIGLHAARRDPAGPA